MELAVERVGAVDLVPVLASGHTLRAVEHRAAGSSATGAVRDHGVEARVHVACGGERAVAFMRVGREGRASVGCVRGCWCCWRDAKRARLTSERARGERTGRAVKKCLARHVTVLALRRAAQAACDHLGALPASRSPAVVVRLLAQVAARRLIGVGRLADLALDTGVGPTFAHGAAARVGVVRGVLWGARRAGGARVRRRRVDARVRRRSACCKREVTRAPPEHWPTPRSRPGRPPPQRPRSGASTAVGRT